MRHLLCVLMALAMTVAATGCGGEADKGINKDKDRPKVDTEEKKT